MPIEIRMPALSPTMESGTLAKWTVKEGDAVESGTILAEIETDKATMEFEGIDEGVVGKLLVAEGTEDVKVGEVIALLLEEGEDRSVLDDYTPAASTGQMPAAEETPKQEDRATQESLDNVKAVSSQPEKASEENKTHKGEGKGERIFASPLARRLAQQKGYDLADIKGSGPRGRIVKRDVEAFTPAEKPAAAVAAGADLEGDAPYREIKLSGMRKTIAKRLTESKQTVPHFYLHIDVELDNLLAARKQLNSMSDEYKISVNDFIIRACALALRKVPEANVQFAGNVMRQFERADISVAVAIDGGLVTPVIRGADQKGLQQISEESKALAAKAREGKLAPEEYQGGTFSVSNLGMFGIKQFQAVINPPQAAILAVGMGEQRPVVKNGELSVATLMSLNLACDHRAIDGAVGARFLQALKTYLETPTAMLL
ncbi:pyruvate dehydrogenase complex dihydrolipoamide acetyltransferase [Luteithermobacter gelatinilyticus]|uniref:pyruvate dehydrogenase complex dihydrolipoamide acetyltransferase n=1 Tax=Luteithermobacter gelatinilyticus TaxID=2582913 RepID=UPI0011072753|nr:pyruvate dehydrogenase complex dihydrolipoamide acetyltransferase [Luteithermobacter gelatinilyticus]